MSDKNKILDAIQNQRWFFFKNKPNIIFERCTALIWANLDYFPYKIHGGPYSYNDAENLINSTNVKGIDGYENWTAPTPGELYGIAEDEKSPYGKNGKNIIKNR